MFVKSIYAKNFRNISEEKIEFGSGINVLYGKNASGKTNALEAIYLFASGKSLRGSPEKDFLQKGCESAKISIEYAGNRSPDFSRNMSMTFLRGNKKIMKYGGVDVPRMSELLGHFRACVFTPDDLLLVKGSPEERRRFIDISISQISPKFVYCLNEYSKLLSQKNIILKNAMISGRLDKVYLSVLNDGLARAASVIVKQRAGFCENLLRYAGDIYRDISGSTELFGMRYVSQTKKNFSDEQYTKDAYIALYEKNLETELRVGVTLVGPHRDDIHFYVGKDESFPEENIEGGVVFDNSHAARSFGSRGQQRSIVLALKLAQGELFREKCGEYPVFLLDDVFSELDSLRREYILSRTADRQVIITCCDCDILGSFKEYNGIYVENGKYSKNQLC